MTAARLLDVIARQEGFRPDVYRDSLGYWSVGCGCLISKDPISELEARERCGAPWTKEQALIKLCEHVEEVEAALRNRFPWFAGLPALVQWGLIDMAYQLGVNGVAMFREMLVAIQTQEWTLAEGHALNSLWAHQTPQRAQEVAAWIGNHEPA